LTVSRVEPGAIARVEPLIEAYPFKPYRHYRVLSRKQQHAVMVEEVRQTLDHRSGVVLEASAGADRALAVGRALEWDSQFFGVPMGRIEYVIAPNPSLLSQLLPAMLDGLAAMGVRHVSARVDVADIPTMGALEDAGFRLMDALVTYTTRPRKEPPHDVREVGAIRAFRDTDGPALIDIAQTAYRGFRGRFHLDAHLDLARCDAFYVEWARQCVSGAMADMIFVSEGADGRPLGFLAFRRREPVSSVGGTPVFGGGLGACRPDVPGAYAGLIRAGTIWAHEHDGVAECQTQNYNFPTVRIYEAVGAHYVRGEYTLHHWIGESEDAEL
jgi:hypothetical protein